MSYVFQKNIRVIWRQKNFKASSFRKWRNSRINLKATSPQHKNEKNLSINKRNSSLFGIICNWEKHDFSFNKITKSSESWMGVIQQLAVSISSLDYDASISSSVVKFGSSVSEEREICNLDFLDKFSSRLWGRSFFFRGKMKLCSAKNCNPFCHKMFFLPFVASSFSLASSLHLIHNHNKQYHQIRARKT